MKQLIIDFLYLDLNTCERCMATDETLKQALKVLSGVFDTLGLEAKINSVNITSRELAEEHRFMSSPTIRVNGVDICNELVESDCTDCGDLCGDSVDCRVFVYEGKNYEQPPVPMIVDGILKAIYGVQPQGLEEAYILPDNLEKFFSGKNSCCGTACGCSDTTSNTNLRSDFSMKTMSIYEPAMCCETGLCGVGIDPELLRISTVMSNLQKNGVTASRFNLNSAPQAFVNNSEINKLIMGDGVESLPATLIDGKIVKTKAYPTNEEIAAWLEIPASFLEAVETKKGDSGCCCSEGCC
ncbi:MAG TPA: hypothetical protein DD738_08805 [Ruminiclostridium sp.]|nr:hypothetical protein [Ruminiclostridium sp.]